MKKRTREHDKFTVREILSVYRGLPLKTRAHVIVRFITCPLLKIEPYVPRAGKILEVGCGHGLFTHILSRASKERDLTGIDIAEDKIAAARRSGEGRIRFICKDFFEFAETGLDAVVLVDVLYLLPFHEQLRMLERGFEALGDSGVLVIMTKDKAPRWKYMVNLLQETMAVRVFRITKGSSLTFHRSGDLKEVLERIGFIVEVVPLHRGYPHPHCLMVCRKNAPVLK